MNIQTFRKMFKVDPQITTIKEGETIKSDFKTKKHRYNISNKQYYEEDKVIDTDVRRYIDEVVF